MIRHDSGIPVYKQLLSIFEEKISSGELKGNDKLPSENELCKKYNVSRTSVRQTLNILNQKGLIYSVHGKGSFVKSPEIKQELSKMVRFGASLQLEGLNGHTKVLEFKNNGELKLLGYANEMPVVYYDSVINRKYVEKVTMKALELQNRHIAFSTFDIYSELGIEIKKVNQVISAETSDKEINLLMELKAPLAMMVIKSEYMDANGDLIEQKTAHYRSDIYSFELNREL
ncbi:MAG: GntR family transcriptional regulator [Lachnospiraceae bacterium]|nr:GntR family transcriptional regulator [Lachnospiraceae bacterium]